MSPTGETVGGLPSRVPAGRRPPLSHANRQGRRRPDQPVEDRLEQALGLVEVDRPANPENAIAEQAFGIGIPVRRPYAFPCWWSKVIGHNSPYPTVPSAFLFRLGKLGRDGRYDEAQDDQPEHPAQPT